MKYKALMSDVDGTLISYDYHSIPSKKVIDAVKKAGKKLSVCIVTGRAYDAIRHILKAFDLHSGYAVVNNGANVVEIGSEKLLYDVPIEKKDAEYILQVLRDENIPVYVKQSYKDSVFEKGEFIDTLSFDKAYMVYSGHAYDEKRVDEIFKKLSHLSEVTIYKTHHQEKGKVGFNMTHVSATKLHGIEVVMKTLGVKKEELIGVGDSYNDFALLMACGLKVAMGNAREDLKAIADYVAPSVLEDGVADVIEKFVLG